MLLPALLDFSVFVCWVASALKFLREKNVVHMDLKPQNILLSSEHNPCLKLAGIFYLFLNTII